MLTTLFCKPTHTGTLCDAALSPSGGLISFRSLDLLRDLPQIHEWVNLPYAASFWNMKGSYGLLSSCYQCLQQNPHAHSFAGLLDDTLTCQLDIYRVQADELGAHLDAGPDDVGFHLIMAPVSREHLRARGLTRAFLHLFISWYFSFEQARTLWAEPDVNNGRSIRLLRLLGFTYVKTIQLSYKTAHLYRLTR